MKRHEIRIPRGYDPRAQLKIGLFASQLDDQLKRLRNNVKDFTVKQLEWQQRPGMNTIGMLLAHLALVEYWWINLAPNGVQWEPDGKKRIHKVCGFEDDGLPMKPNERHPKYLKGYNLENYLKVLTKVRNLIHREMKNWHDRDLEKSYKLGNRQISRMWTLYHVLEHFAGHFGQVLLLKHLMRDAGILKVKIK